MIRLVITLTLFLLMVRNSSQDLAGFFKAAFPEITDGDNPTSSFPAKVDKIVGKAAKKMQKIMNKMVKKNNKRIRKVTNTNKKEVKSFEREVQSCLSSEGSSVTKKEIMWLIDWVSYCGKIAMDPAATDPNLRTTVTVTSNDATSKTETMKSSTKTSTQQPNSSTHTTTNFLTKKDTTVCTTTGTVSTEQNTK